MHFEILVEGQTELTALSILIPKIVGDYGAPNTWKIHKHRGVGRLPDNPQERPNPHDPTLLHQLPAKLRAYSKNQDPTMAVIVLLDLDDKDKDELNTQLNTLLEYCEAGFEAEFKFAVEELEAWYMGDRNALLMFNPEIRQNILNNYIQDSICDTWEELAKADSPFVLTQGKRNSATQEKKKEWSKKIPLHMDVNNNLSPSFNEFTQCLRMKLG